MKKAKLRAKLRATRQDLTIAQREVDLLHDQLRLIDLQRRTGWRRVADLERIIDSHNRAFTTLTDCIDACTGAYPPDPDWARVKAAVEATVAELDRVDPLNRDRWPPRGTTY
jgi:hypothetical protein